MTGMFKDHKSGYFYGRHSLTSKTVAFFSKEEDLKEWLRESWRRVQISAVKAHDILGKDFGRVFKATLDKEIVEQVPEWDEIIKSRTPTKAPREFDSYRDFYRGFNNYKLIH